MFNVITTSKSGRTANHNVNELSTALFLALMYAGKGVKVDIVSNMTGEILLSTDMNGMPYVSDTLRFVP